MSAEHAVDGCNVGDDVSPSHTAPIGADFTRFFAVTLSVGVLLIGLAYANEYFRSFGLSLVELDLSEVEAVIIASYWLQYGANWFVLTVMATLVSLMASAARFSFGDRGYHLMAALLFVLLVAIAAMIGTHSAKSHSALITKGAGRIAFCQLRDDAHVPSEFADRFAALTRGGRVRKIIETSETMYFSIVLDSVPEGFRGQSIGIRKADVAYCRVLGN